MFFDHRITRQLRGSIRDEVFRSGIDPEQIDRLTSEEMMSKRYPALSVVGSPRDPNEAPVDEPPPSRPSEEAPIEEPSRDPTNPDEEEEKKIEDPHFEKKQNTPMRAG